LAAPAKARIELLDLLIFNILIGNGDAHAKNYSVLHPPDEKPILAPAYDLMSTRYYFGRRSKMAMKLGGYREFERIYLRHWQRFSQEVSLAFPMVRATLVNIEARLQRAIAEERDHIATEEAQQVLDYLSGHASAMARQAQTGPTSTSPLET
jgi:serine/threonine-protein kinase HipA